MLCEIVSSVETVKIIKADGKVGGTKYRGILEEKLPEAT